MTSWLSSRIGTEATPVQSVIGLRTPLLLAMAVLLLLCFLAGVLVLTTLARKGFRTVESAGLSKVPGYALLIFSVKVCRAPRRSLPIAPVACGRSAPLLAFLLRSAALSLWKIPIPAVRNERTRWTLTTDH